MYHLNDENFKEVTARVEIQNGNKIKIAMRTELTQFLLSKENVEFMEVSSEFFMVILKKILN